VWKLKDGEVLDDRFFKSIIVEEQQENEGIIVILLYYLVQVNLNKQNALTLDLSN
jgi:hypothetical protein